MEIRVAERGGVRFLECADRIARVDDALDLISACVENRAHRVLIDSSWLPEAFFDLRSRFAGEFVQKLENYRLRVAAIFDSDVEHGERFEEFLSEARRGKSFRAFADRTEAETWLCSE